MEKSLISLEFCTFTLYIFINKSIIMKNIDCLICLQGLREVNAPNMEPKFNMRVSHNIRQLEEVSTDLEKAREISDEFKTYNDERIALNTKHAEKDDAGNPKKVVVAGPGGQEIENFIIKAVADPKSPYNKEMDRLKEKHKAAIDARDAQVEKYTTLLDEEAEGLKLLKVDEDMIPKGLNRNASNAVYFMTKIDLDDEEETPAKPDKKK